MPFSKYLRQTSSWVWKTLKKFWAIGWKTLLGYAVTCALVILAAFIIVPEVTRPLAVIDVAAVPKAISEAGYTPVALSGRVIGEIARIDYEVREDSRTTSKKAFRGADEKDLPEFEIPGTKLSVKEAIHWLREELHYEPTSIRISVTNSDRGVESYITIQDGQGYLSHSTVKGDAAGFTAQISLIAERILAELDPTKLALYLYSAQRRQEGEKVLDDCITGLDTEQKSRCLTTRADMDIEESHYTKAQGEYWQALAWNKDWAAAYSGLGLIEGIEGNSAKALEYYQRALKADGSLRSVHFNFALLSKDNGDWKSALREAEASVESGERGAAGLALIGAIQYATLHDPEAKANFLKAVAADPKSASTYVAWGKALFARGLTGQGNEKFEIAKKLRPLSSSIYNAWGNSLSDLWQSQAAAVMHRQALALNPQNPDFHANLARDLMSTGEFDEAEREFAAALHLENDAWDVLASWGTLLAREGRVDEALGKWKAAAKLNPSGISSYAEWGNFLYSMGYFSLAAEQFRAAVRSQPDDFYSHSNLGRTLTELGLFDEANEEFRQAMRLSPGAWGTLSYWGTLLARQGRVQEAMAKWEEAGRINPAAQDPYFEKGVFLLGQGNDADAADQFRETIRRNPTLDAAHGNLAIALMGLRDYSGADREFQEAMRMNPHAWGILANWGTLLGRQGLTEAAIARWTDAAKLNPAGAEPYTEWGNFLYAQGDFAGAALKHREAVQRGPNDAVAHWNLARDLMEVPDYAGAEKEFQEAMRVNPRSWVAQSYWGTLLARQGHGRLQDAIKKWNAAATLNPSATEPFSEWGNFLYGQADYVGAAAAYREAVKRGPNDARLHLNLARDLMESQDYAGAEKEFQEAIRVNPHYWVALSYWGTLLARQGPSRLPDAIQKWNAAASLNPAATEPYTERGDFLFGQGDYKAAELQYRQAGNRAPNDAGVHTSLARDLMESQDYAGAEREFQEAIRVNPHSWLALSYWGTLLARQGPGHWSDAMKKWSAAASLNPAATDPFTEWGNFLWGQGDYLGAATPYREALKRAPNDAGVHTSLARVLMGSQDYAGAEKEFQEAMRVNPHSVAQSYWGMLLARQGPGRLQDAIAKWNAAASLNPAATDPYTEWGSFLSGQGDYVGVAAPYREAVKRSPNDAGMHTNLALDLMELRDYAGAEKELQEAMRVNPHSWVAQSYWGTLLARQGPGRLQDAIAKWNAAAVLNPVATEPYTEWGNFLYAQGDYAAAALKHREAVKRAPNDAGAHTTLARDLMELRDYPGAEKEFQEAMRVNPHSWLAQSYWGTLLARQGPGRLGDAKKKWNAAADLNRAATEPFIEWGDFLFGQGKYQDAELPYREAVKRAPNDAGVHVSLARDLMEWKPQDFTGAEKEFQEAVRVNPHSWLAKSFWGTLLARQGPGRLEDAKKKWKEAADLNRAATEPYTEWGNFLYGQQNYKDAEPPYREAVKRGPNDARTHTNLALALMGLDPPDYEGAEQEFQEAIRVNPHALNSADSPTLAILGDDLAQKGNCGLAREAYDSAVKYLAGKREPDASKLRRKAAECGKPAQR
jgi:tetratricopeptide (TPR) repeat protein